MKFVIKHIPISHVGLSLIFSVKPPSKVEQLRKIFTNWQILSIISEAANYTENCLKQKRYLVKFAIEWTIFNPPILKYESEEVICFLLWSWVGRSRTKKSGQVKQWSLQPPNISFSFHMVAAKDVYQLASIENLVCTIVKINFPKYKPKTEIGGFNVPQKIFLYNCGGGGLGFLRGCFWYLVLHFPIKFRLLL